jgi:hypothetical protein
MITSNRSPLCHRFATVALLTLCFGLLTKSRPLNAGTPGGFSGATMLAADRADLALDTGLWRGEFLKTQEDDTSPAPGDSVDENHQSLQSMRTSNVRDNSDLVNLEGAAEEYFEAGEVVSVQSSGDEVVVTGEMAENLTDWEQAICNVSDGKTLAAGQKGPSMITAIVAVVGLIVVIGAYMKK